MSRSAVALLLLVAARADGHDAGGEPLILAREDRAAVQAVAAEMICHCGCPRQTVADCVCGMADEIREGIWTELQAGKAADQVVDAYVTEHGSQFRSMPQKKGLGLAAWALPWASILLAGACVLPVVRRWSRVPAAPDVAPASLPPDGYQSRIDEEIHDLD